MKTQIGKLVVFSLPVIALGIIAARRPVLYASAMEQPAVITPQVAGAFRLFDAGGAVLDGSVSTSVEVLPKKGMDSHKCRVCALKRDGTRDLFPEVSEVLDLGEPRDVFGFEMVCESPYFPGNTVAELSGSNDRVHFTTISKVTTQGKQHVGGHYRFWRLVCRLDRFIPPPAPVRS